MPDRRRLLDRDAMYGHAPSNRRSSSWLLHCSISFSFSYFPFPFPFNLIQEDRFIFWDLDGVWVSEYVIIVFLFFLSLLLIAKYMNEGCLLFFLFFLPLPIILCYFFCVKKYLYIFHKSCVNKYSALFFLV